MKTQLFFTAAALVSFAGAQVYSDVVGYVKLGSQTGDSVAANTDVTVSIPFVQPTEAIYTVSAWTFDTNEATLGGTITINETMTAGAFDIPATGAPYMIEVSSGLDEGIFLEVSSNTANVINLTGYGTEFLSQIAQGDTITVRKAWTISTAFGVDLPDGSRLITYDETGINNSVSRNFQLISGAWTNLSTFQSADDVVVYPGEYFTLRNTSGAAIPEAYVSGVIPSSNSRIVLKKDSTAPQDTRFSYISPTTETIATSGLNDIANENDRIIIYSNDDTGINKTPTKVLVYSSGVWLNTQTFGDESNTELVGGQAYIYRRNDTGTSDTFVTDEQTYQPNL